MPRSVSNRMGSHDAAARVETGAIRDHNDIGEGRETLADFR